MQPVRRGELAGDVQAIALDLLDGLPNQPRHLSRMRRDHHLDAVARHEPVGIAAERVQGVRVEHERHTGALHQSLYERRRRRRGAQSRADGDHVGLDVEHAIERGEIDRAFRGLVERHSHVLGHHRRDHRQA